MDTRRINSITLAAGIIMCSLVVLLSGCLLNKEEYNEQKSWVDLMNDTFTDDHFEYGGPAFNSIGAQSSYCAVIKSEKYPQEEIGVFKDENRLYTNYYDILYKSESEEYFSDYFSGKFKCDGCDVKISRWQKETPIRIMSAEEYIKDYVDLNGVDVIIYRKDGVFPDKNDMKDILINICKERDEVCDFTLYCCKEKTTRENVKNTCECYFHVFMGTENSISHMNCKYKEGKEYDLLWNYSW